MKREVSETDKHARRAMRKTYGNHTTAGRIGFEDKGVRNRKNQPKGGPKKQRKSRKG